MTKQEAINQFIQTHCSCCENKDSNKCKIVINREGNVKCLGEKKIKK